MTTPVKHLKAPIKKSSSNGKSLKASNVYLHSAKSSDFRVRSIASSTAIETGESIKKLESKIKKIRAKGYSVALCKT